jgi:hypothetical protein
VNDKSAIASYRRVMKIVDGRRHVMKRIAVVIGIVIGIAATPTVVAAGDSNRPSQRDRYEHARDWGTPLGQVYGPVRVGPSEYGYYSK